MNTFELRRLALSGCLALGMTGCFRTVVGPGDGAVESGIDDAQGPDTVVTDAVDTDAMPVHAQRPIHEISAGGSHTCITDATNKVICWGSNGSQALLQPGVAFVDHPIVMNVPPLHGIDVGFAHACGIVAGGDADGRAFCFGSNARGQLGIGSSMADGLGMVAIIGPVASISAGADFTCAIDAGTSQVYCWGDNTKGQLGLGTRSATVVTEPGTSVSFTGESTASIVATGGQFACVRHTSLQSVECWGLAEQGQLGVNSSTAGGTPLASGMPLDSGETNAMKLSAGGQHMCSLHPDGTVFCWGEPTDGKTGENVMMVPPSTPSLVDMNLNATAISAGGTFTCALTPNNRVVCWGANDVGQLGNGEGGMSPTPVAVTMPNGCDVAFVSVGQQHACAVCATSANEVYCWGSDAAGQLGNGPDLDGAHSITPVLVGL